jgi:hypothetical protein
MKSRILQKPPFLPTLVVAGALGLALTASSALAQAGGNRGNNPAASANPNQGDSGASSANPDSVSGVVVPGQRRPTNPPIPADKKAAYDAEVAKEEAWRRYRKSMPPASDSTIDQAKDYPGLQSLLPGQDQAPESR